MVITAESRKLDNFAGDGNNEILPVPPRMTTTDWHGFLCIFGDCFVKYVHKVLVQARWET